jgi:hypothetical protein
VQVLPHSFRQPVEAVAQVDRGRPQPNAHRGGKFSTALPPPAPSAPAARSPGQTLVLPARPGHRPAPIPERWPLAGASGPRPAPLRRRAGRRRAPGGGAAKRKRWVQPSGVGHRSPARSARSSATARSVIATAVPSARAVFYLRP